MWKQRYRRNFVPNQAIILTVCLVLEIHWQMPAGAIFVFFAVMQLGAFLGAMWTTRLMSKFDPNSRAPQLLSGKL